MNGNDRQNQISPPSPSASPSSHLLTRSHMQSDHFFSYDSATTVGPSDQYQLQKSIFQLRLWSDSQLRFHPRRPTIAPRRFDENSSVETQGVAARYKSLASPSPFFGPNRNTAASWLKAAVGPKSAPEIRHRCQGVAARYKIACSPACSPPLFRPQSDHGPTLAQSYSRNNTNTMRADR